MSSEALAWAFKINVKPSALKFTLVALCECANFKTGHIYPSIAHLEEITGQDRKTLIANIAKLEELGLIVDTGERAGKTGQIKVYRATTETVPKTEQFQKRNSTTFPPKQSQKRYTEPSREPSTPSIPNGIDCPPCGEPALKPDHISEEWNTLAAKIGKPCVRDLTPERRQLLKARIAQYGMDDFLTVFGKIERSRFLRGDTGWRGGNFDWVFKKANFQKILEGNYDD